MGAVRHQAPRSLVPSHCRRPHAAGVRTGRLRPCEPCHQGRLEARLALLCHLRSSGFRRKLSSIESSLSASKSPCSMENIDSCLTKGRKESAGRSCERMLPKTGLRLCGTSCKELIRMVSLHSGEGGSRNYAAAEKWLASLNQWAIRFHLGQIWATILKPLILNGDRSAAPVHRICSSWIRRPAHRGIRHGCRARLLAPPQQSVKSCDVPSGSSDGWWMALAHPPKHVR